MTGQAIPSLPLFVPELCLGLDELLPEDRQRLSAFVRAAVRSRGFPLHVGSIWNMIAFGYDLEERSYDDRLLHGIGAELHLGGQARALPIGSLCWVRLGDSTTWAEIVGAYRQPSDIVNEWGELEAPLSVQDLDHDDPVIVQELLVLDFQAFGASEPDFQKRFERHKRKGRVTPRGHIEIDAEYGSMDAVREDDLTQLAKYLYYTQSDLLKSSALVATLEDPSNEEHLAGALLTSLQTTRDLCATTVGLRQWGEYFFDSEWYADVERAPSMPLGASDLDAVLNSLARIGDAQTATYQCLHHRLTELVGRGGPPLREEEGLQRRLLNGVDYITEICKASRYIADRVAESGGTVRNDVHLRIDDFRIWGGLWRAAHVDQNDPLLDVPPDRALGLYDPGRVQPDLESGRAEEGVDPESHIEATVVLRRSHLAWGTLPVPAPFWDAQLEHGALLRLSHAGDCAPEHAHQMLEPLPGRRQLMGALWPLDFFPGIKVHLCRLAGSNVLFATTVPLAVPVFVADTFCNFAFDESLLSGRALVADESELLDTLIRALKRRGHPDAPGMRCGTAQEIAYWALGNDRPRGLDEAVDAALEAAQREGQLSRQGSRFAAEIDVSTEGELPAGAAFRPGGSFSLPRTAMRAHWVPGFLRRLAPDRIASDQQRQRYAEDRARGIVGGPRELPEGYTYVRGHRRGETAAAWHEALSTLVPTDH